MGCAGPGAVALLGTDDGRCRTGLARYGAFAYPDPLHTLAWLLRRAISVEAQEF